jgi:cation diffusion facilitator CzcD-associated flavoprotein CzcO
MSNTEVNKKVDVLIVGAGIAGATGCQFGQNGKKYCGS